MMQTSEPSPQAQRPARKSWWYLWIPLLVLVLVAAAYLRFTGMNWDANQHLHPDERFLTMVESAISPAHSLSEYFNTAQSPLNPHNRGYGFYVYGDLPLIIVRYFAEWVGQTGYDEVFLVGRYTSATFDLLTVLLVFLAAQRLYRKPWLSLLASAFYALAVLPIQLAHYFTVDSFLTFFGLLTLYFAFVVSTSPPPKEAVEAVEDQSTAGVQVFEAPTDKNYLVENLPFLGTQWASAIPYVLFGAALGTAMATKVSAFLIAVTLPLAAYVFWSRLPDSRKGRWLLILLRNLVIGALVAFVFFRIFQPYAFSGPGFFGLKINPQWMANIKELGAQSTGDVDFPPALQWARRPVYFAYQNMIVWGLGLPLGILAWAGFLWMVTRMVRGEWRQHLVLWFFTLFYSLWWGLNFSRTMRYQNLVYPTLAIIAAWTIAYLWQRRNRVGRSSSSRLQWSRILAVALAVTVLAATAVYAVAFAGIYQRPMTRVAASQWIYQNVPAAINVKIDTQQGTQNHPLGFRYNYDLYPGDEWVIAFVAQESTRLDQVRFAHVADYSQSMNNVILSVELRAGQNGSEVLSSGFTSQPFPVENERGNEVRIPFQSPVQLNAGETYYLAVSLSEFNSPTLSFSGPVALDLIGANGAFQQPLPEPVMPLRDGSNTYSTTFTAGVDGTVKEIVLPHVIDWTGSAERKTLTLSIYDQTGSSDSGSSAATNATFQPGSDWRGDSYTFVLDRPFVVGEGQSYTVSLTKSDGPGAIAIYGSKTALESTWDDPLPLPMGGYSPFDTNNGLYRTDLNFEMYWDDDPNKLDRFISILNQTDYILISSNRQWGTTTRVPERYPLTSYYYRALIGCPVEEAVFDCYAQAKPGMFKGQLGFDLVQVFQSDPKLGLLDWNTQYAEEAFTVYDAPKVLIFKKTGDYSAEAVQQMLARVDLSTVVHVTPRKVGSNPANLMLPPVLLAIQRAGGTWSQLFNAHGLYNTYPGLALVLWYLVISLLGWVVYPIVRLALHGLPDHGYPFSKLVGMLLLAYFTWLAGSSGIAFSRLTITLLAVLLLAAGLVLAFIQRDELAQEWRERKRYFLMVEGVALAFFAVDLLIRLGNPDLWHPYKGGEKPMDFSYFNAVIKSTIFPPYDPWFAGGYINYYYFGFVIAAVPVKWLGIMPSIAYNLLLPTFFAMLALGAFSVAWNLFSARRRLASDDDEPLTYWQRYRVPLAAGLVAAVAVVLLGNLGTVRMIWHGIMRLAAPDGNLDGSNFIERFSWTFKGIMDLLGGAHLPYGDGDWYWIPSRVYAGTEITEFPFFTFLYADPHAHLFALPLTLLALAWSLSIVMGKWHWGDRNGRYAALHFLVSFFLGGVVIGSLRPVNTWDLPTYLALGVVSIAYTSLRYSELFMGRFFEWPERRRKLLTAGWSILLLVVLAVVLYEPYARWYQQGYNSVELWQGARSPFWSYMTHWGLFLFVIVSWMVWETREWMASTPVSALNQLKPYRALIIGLAALLGAAVVGLLVLKVAIAWLVLPLAVWAALLILRPGQPDVKRFVLFMIGTALVLTLAVEVIVLKGDIDRMNTVFKFYLQAWTLLALSAAAGLVWLWPAVEQAWDHRWGISWQVVLAVMVSSALLYPITASAFKIKDRMAPAAPHTLDGMAYMPYATYADFDYDMKLIQDYMAIRWMQDNVQGSPVIVEANTPEYRWGTRFTIYTGLPGVVGWNWHQRQQRTNIPGEWVFNRVDAISRFYQTEDRQETINFLRQYDVKYIVVGQLERAEYRSPGLNKFVAWDGDLWKLVFQIDETAIYEVNP